MIQHHEPHYDYEGYHGCKSFCDVRIHVLTSGETLTMFTELEENMGTSVTNRSEHLATRICQEYHLNPTKTIFLERYPREQGRNAPVLPETSKVTYTWNGLKASRPIWTYLKPDEVHELFSQFKVV